MAITTRTRVKVAAVLQERGVGRGLTVPQLRRLYPAGAVRRTSIMEALADLEAMGHVEWNGQRVRWATAEYDVERVFGDPVRRIERDRALAPADRGAVAAALSNALVRRSGA